jgi:hypothetical protein
VALQIGLWYRSTNLPIRYTLHTSYRVGRLWGRSSKYAELPYTLPPVVAHLPYTPPPVVAHLPYTLPPVRVAHLPYTPRLAAGALPRPQPPPAAPETESAELPYNPRGAGVRRRAGARPQPPSSSDPTPRRGAGLIKSEKSRRRRAYPQQIVTTRLLYCLQDPFAQLSRLQRI